MAFELPDLPYADNALEPHYSANTFSFHHKKHHNAYVTKANELVAGTDLDSASLEEAIAEAHKSGNQGLFNQDITDPDVYSEIQQRLLETAKYSIDESVRSILLVDFARQDQ